jgi:hypothetical protein
MRAEKKLVRSLVFKHKNVNAAMDELRVYMQEAKNAGRPFFNPEESLMNDAYRVLRGQESEQAAKDGSGLVKDRYVHSCIITLDRISYSFFMDRSCAHFLSKSVEWYIDSTFWAAPESVRQLWNIMGYRDGAYMPCAHFLLRDSKTETYMWGMLELLSYVFGPTPDVTKLPGEIRIMTDFEWPQRKGIERAWIMFFDPDEKRREKWKNVIYDPGERHEFIWNQDDWKVSEDRAGPKLRMAGCLFHISQADVRNFRSGFPPAIGQSLAAIARREARAMGGELLFFFLWLPYFGKDFILMVFAILKESAGVRKYAACAAYVEYFEKQWMSCIDWWRIDEKDWDGRVTNCGVERFHGILKGMLKKAHPRWTDLGATLRDYGADKLRKIGLNKPRPLADICDRRKLARSDQKELIAWKLAVFAVEFGTNDEQSVSVEKIMEAVNSFRVKQKRGLDRGDESTTVVMRKKRRHARKVPGAPRKAKRVRHWHDTVGVERKLGALAGPMGTDKILTKWEKGWEASKAIARRIPGTREPP